MLAALPGRPSAGRPDGPSFARGRCACSRARRRRPAAAAEPDADWSRVSAGPWLAEALAGPARPEALAARRSGRRRCRRRCARTSRSGVRWLHLLSDAGPRRLPRRRHGAGQDDPGARAALGAASGKAGDRQPSLLVAPASLLANWAAEIERFAPGLTVARRASVGDAARPSSSRCDRAGSPTCDLVITSYGSLLRIPWLAARPGGWSILDEAQAIKNPGAKQTRAVKALKAQRAHRAHRHAGREPARRSVVDLRLPQSRPARHRPRSSPRYAKRLAERPHNPYGPLRDLVRPYILRRLKTDKRVIADLPDKTEVKAYCPLSRKQAALYQQAVAELAEQLDERRRHPAPGPGAGVPDALQADLQPPVAVAGRRRLGRGATAASSRGCARLAEAIAARQEKVLVFTQFREMTAPLAAFLAAVFGRPGPGAPRRDRGQAAQGAGASASRRTRRCRSSCCRSRPAAPGST